MAPSTKTLALAVANAGLDGLMTVVWVAAGELSPMGRRGVRLGVTTAVAAVGYVTTKDKSEPPAAAEDEPQPPAGDDGEPAVPPFDKRKMAVTAALLAVSVGTMVGRRRLERRWTARLAEQGHPHPTRALAVRLGALAFGAGLLRQLAEAPARR